MKDPRKELNGVVMDCVSHPKGGWSATVHLNAQVPVGTYLAPVAQQAHADLEAENKRLMWDFDAVRVAHDRRQAENARLRRIAWLIGSIFVHGNFKAETGNERELESLLRENGTFWESLADFDARAALESKP